MKKTIIAVLILFVVVIIPCCFLFLVRDPIKDEWLKTPSDTIIDARFSSKPDIFTSYGINLHADQTYFFYFGSCTGSSSDSGFYRILNDTLFFRSVLEKRQGSPENGFDEIAPITEEKYLYKNNRIYYHFENGEYHPDAYWLKEGLVWDSSSTGFSFPKL